MELISAKEAYSKSIIGKEQNYKIDKDKLNKYLDKTMIKIKEACKHGEFHADLLQGIFPFWEISSFSENRYLNEVRKILKQLGYNTECCVVSWSKEDID